MRALDPSNDYQTLVLTLFHSPIVGGLANKLGKYNVLSTPTYLPTYLGNVNSKNLHQEWNREISIGLDKHVISRSQHVYRKRRGGARNNHRLSELPPFQELSPQRAEKRVRVCPK